MHGWSAGGRVVRRRCRGAGYCPEADFRLFIVVLIQLASAAARSGRPSSQLAAAIACSHHLSRPRGPPVVQMHRALGLGTLFSSCIIFSSLTYHEISVFFLRLSRYTVRPHYFLRVSLRSTLIILDSTSYDR